MSFWAFFFTILRWFSKNRIFKTKWPSLGPKKWSKHIFTLKTVQTPLKFDVFQKSSISIKNGRNLGGHFFLGKCGSILTFVKLGLKNIVTICAFVVNRGLTKQKQFLHSIGMYEFQNWDLLYRICKIWPFCGRFYWIIYKLSNLDLFETERINIHLGKFNVTVLRLL